MTTIELYAEAAAWLVWFAPPLTLEVFAAYVIGAFGIALAVVCVVTGVLVGIGEYHDTRAERAAAPVVAKPAAQVIAEARRSRGATGSPELAFGPLLVHLPDDLDGDQLAELRGHYSHAAA